MLHLDKLVNEALRNQMILTALSSLILAVLAYLNSKLKALTARAETDQTLLKEQAESNKRSALRNEYLTIYNSPNFTAEQKWGMTRDIMKEYERLDGNHYLHALDSELQIKVGGAEHAKTM